MAGINYKQIGRDIMAHMTLEVDFAPVDRGTFGWRRWRLRAAILLIKAAGRVLRCGIQITETTLTPNP